MKQFLKCVMEWKAATCYLYTGTMAIYLFFCTVFRNDEISLAMLWALLAVSVAATLIQGVCFSNWIFKKMRYTWRSVLFVALFLPVLSFAAWKVEWFPVERASAWIMFIGIFFLIFLGMTIGFDIYFRITGRKYDGMLGQYRRQKEEKGE
ncbi:MAG: hypothetical protein K2O84_06845 [Oscillospiraceae bacterium]|nr:hypothetical protein [Oscillospiraceae bacterium]